MKRKRLLFIMSMGLIVPNLGSCSAPTIVDKIIVDGKDKIEIGETASFKANIYPTPKSEQTINWTTSNSNVAYVDKDGNVTGTSKGKATITAKVGRTETKQDVFIGGYIEHPVESISLNGQSNLKVGEYIQLSVTVSPENATNKDVIWTSSDSKIASVNENGVVKGELNGETTITATSKDGNKVASTTISVTAQTDKLTIKSFSEPDCLVHYKEKIAHLEDKIDETKINRNNSKQYINNNFFKYDEDEKDKQIYKVGIDNPFRFKCNITTAIGDDPFKEIHDNNPYQKLKIEEKKSSDIYEDVTNNFVSSFNEKENEIQFGSDDVEKIYRITATLDDTKYTGTEIGSMSATLEVKIIEGYNAYDFAGLTTIDNWTEEQAKIAFNDLPEEMEIIKKGEFIDLWGKYKDEHKISKENINATILHNDIAIELDELPDTIVWTEHEVFDYVNGIKFPESKDNFDEFVEIKKSIHQDDWKDLPNNVVRAKCINMLYKSKKDFTYIFHRSNRNTSSDYRLEGNYFALDCSQIKPVCLFENRTLPNYQLVDINETSIIGIGMATPNRTHSKTTISGEHVYDTFRPYYGSIRRAEKKFIINNLNAFGNSTKDGTHDESIGTPTFINPANMMMTNSIIHKFGTTIHLSWSDCVIDMCKLFDTYSHIILNRFSLMEIKNSIIKDGDGGCVRMLANDGDRDIGLHATNSYFESFISGNEPYNKTYIKTIFVSIMSQLGNECFEKYKNIKFGKDGKYAPNYPRNFIKKENDVIYINNIITNEINGSSVTEHKDNFVADGVPIFNLNEDYGENGHLSQYTDLQLISCCMESAGKQKDKGHARLPIRDIVSANDIQTYYDDGYSSAYLSEYVNDKDNYDEKNPEVGANFGRLFCGDYITIMFDLINKIHFSFVLGYK